jgi:hypothetical protein
MASFKKRITLTEMRALRGKRAVLGRKEPRHQKLQIGCVLLAALFSTSQTQHTQEQHATTMRCVLLEGMLVCKVQQP